MMGQQLFQLAITLLFVAVLIELFVALTLFHWRMWKEERKRKRSNTK